MQICKIKQVFVLTITILIVVQLKFVTFSFFMNLLCHSFRLLKCLVYLDFSYFVYEIIFFNFLCVHTVSYITIKCLYIVCLQVFAIVSFCAITRFEGYVEVNYCTDASTSASTSQVAHLSYSYPFE